MLQSNIGASSFKLQPAPPPKSKKRPMNPPPLSIVLPAKNTIVDKTNGTDKESSSSCFEDQDLATPRASLQLPADQDKFADSDGASVASVRRDRSSTFSISSANSTRSKSSVTRLLAALSTSPRRPNSTATSPSVTLTVMLTNKSPTPSSPLFPRRTLMRSLSSTCINTFANPPPSPSSRSPDVSLRKRIGWRGALSASRAQETAILMSPGSPLTPRRAEALHTPTQASISSLLDRQHLTPDDSEGQVEPLSATLKALGAKRHTERFPSICVPVQSPTSATAGELDLLDHLKSLDSDLQLTGHGDKFQVMTATRKIFHLPTWVRFEANHHARSQAVEDNRKAAAEFAELQRQLAIARADEIESVVAQATLPKTSRLGDVAPDSPNGELFAGFEVPDHDAHVIDGSSVKGANLDGELVVKVVRRPTLAALREMDKPGRTNAGMAGAIRSALPGFRSQGRIKSPRRPASAKITLVDDADRRDGWGGILTRCSWFPSHTKGPLVSPISVSTAKSRSGLKPMHLVPSLPAKSGKTSMDDDEWEDLPEPVPSSTAVEHTFLDLNDAPRFFNRPPAQRGFFRFLSRPSRPSAKKEGEWIDETELNVWRTMPSNARKVPDIVSSQMITKGTESVENRPLRVQKTSSRRGKIAILAVTAVLIAAIVGNVVILSHTTHTSKASAQDGHPPRLNGTVSGWGLGVGLGTINGSGGGANESSVVEKAAQLSQP